jgi:hypothetical protein
VPRVYYSTVIDQTADTIWQVIRDFGRYEWAPGVAESAMEAGKAGDAVGGVRAFSYGGERMRQRLLTHSDLDRSYTFELCDPNPMRNYQSTLRVSPVVNGNQAFIEWWATFDCAEDEESQWMTWLLHNGFPVWLSGLTAIPTSLPQSAD